MIRAVLEGVALSMGQIAGLMQQAGVPIERIRIGGGGARSTLWRTILASALDAPIISTNAEEGPAYGAALLAGVGIGVWPNVRETCGATIKETETIDPDSRWSSVYAELAPTFDAMYYDLTDRFSSLTAIATRLDT
jgi:xylulokinase